MVYFDTDDVQVIDPTILDGESTLIDILIAQSTEHVERLTQRVWDKPSFPRTLRNDLTVWRVLCDIKGESGRNARVMRKYVH